jgi:hypothetical protein
LQGCRAPLLASQHRPCESVVWWPAPPEQPDETDSSNISGVSGMSEKKQQWRFQWPIGCTLLPAN